MQKPLRMKVAIMQPYLFPYIGYFQLINAVDTFVFLDDVNFINRGWINRNNLIINKLKARFTISLQSAGQNKLINEISILDDFVKFRKTLRYNYSKAPHYQAVMDAIERICAFGDRNLSHFIANSLHVLMDYIGIGTATVFSSELAKDGRLHGQDRIIAICRLLRATTYINPIGGVELYDRSCFDANGIALYFLRSSFRPYPQFGSNFEPALSIIDVMMHNSPAAIREMLGDFRLV